MRPPFHPQKEEFYEGSSTGEPLVERGLATNTPQRLDIEGPTQCLKSWRAVQLASHSVFAFFAAGSSSPSSSSSRSPSSSSSPSKSASSSSSSSSSSSKTFFHSAAVIGFGRSSSGSPSLLASKYSAALMKASAVPLGPSFSTICSTSSKSSPTPRMSTGTMISSSFSFSGKVNSLTISWQISSLALSFVFRASSVFLQT